MDYLNKLEELPKKSIKEKNLRTLVLLLSPFAPHISEELAHTYLKIKKPLIQLKWPNYEIEKIKETKTVYAVQINGKTKKTIELLQGLSQKEVEKRVLPLIEKYLKNQKIKKIIFVQDKIINFVFK
jgi:leucyl-tRNA synthetase